MPETTLLVHFWLPLALFPLGVALMLARDPPRKWVGRVLLIGCLLAPLLNDWDFISTGEAQALHLGLVVLGPTLMCAVGCLLALFGGPTPFAPLPEGVRQGGFLLLAGGIAWFGWLLFVDRPDISGTANPFWLHLITSLLTLLVVIGGFAAAFTIMMGDRRWREALAMGGIAITSFILLIFLLAQGTEQDDPVFWRSASWGALGDLLGLLVGGVGALLTFVLVVWIGERNMPVPEPVAPLSESEQARAREILAEHAGDSGGEQE